MTERRYSEEEVAAIFEQATEAQQHARRQLPPGEGMTLSDLQEIGREVGIPPELVTQAARSIRAGSPAESRTMFGIPYRVGRTVDLDRRLSDDEWERLVVDLRQTFDARGVVRADGSLRQWTNGNLQVLLEPTATGQRVRMRTVNGSARNSMAMGVAVMVGATSSLLIKAMSVGLTEAKVVVAIALLSVLGVGMALTAAIRLPRWASTRQRQMDGIAARLSLLPTPLPPGSSDRLTP